MTKKGKIHKEVLGNRKNAAILLICGILFVLILIFVFAFDRLCPSVVIYEDRGPEYMVSIAQDLRETIVDLSTDAGHDFSSYEDMQFANDALSYNTCQRDQELLSREAWTRDWIYLIVGDKLYSEIKGDESYFAKSQVLLDTLYMDYEIDGRLDAYTLHGNDSYCMPYLMLRDWKNNSDLFEYMQTYELAKNLCKDFYYSEENLFLTYRPLEELCQVGDVCVDESDFYEHLEQLLSTEIVDMADLRMDIFEGEEVWERPVDVVADNYIVAYELENDAYIDSVNYRLLADLYGFMISMHTERYVNDRAFDTCNRIPHYHAGLVRAMLVKGNLISDEILLEKHKLLQEDLIALCSVPYGPYGDNENLYDYDEDSYDYYMEFASMVENGYDLGRSIEFSYLLKDYLNRNSLKDYIALRLDNSLVHKRYNRSDYVFVYEPDYDFVNLVRWNRNDDCFDKDLSLKHNAKAYLYLLMYSKYYD